MIKDITYLPIILIRYYPYLYPTIPRSLSSSIIKQYLTEKIPIIYQKIEKCYKYIYSNEMLEIKEEKILHLRELRYNSFHEKRKYVSHYIIIVK